MVVGRWALLVAAGLAFASALALTRGGDGVGGSAEQSSLERYLCPMHPEVISFVSGDCPICRMALMRAKVAQSALDSAARVRRTTLSPVERRIVTQLVRAPAWISRECVVTAVLHRDDLVGLAPDERALFFPTAAPGAGISVRLSSEPLVAWDASTVRVRFEAEEPACARQETGWLQLAARPRELLVVPASAVLYSGEGAYVLLAPQGGQPFTRRSIEIGRILDSGHAADLVGGRDGAVVVLSGLEEGERVAASDAFFLDAERRLQAAQEEAPEGIP